MPAPDRFRWLLVAVLRGGVVFAAALIAAGLSLYFLLGVDRPLDAPLELKSAALGMASITGHGGPVALLSFGLFVLICLPIARVGLCLFHFARERDRAYSALSLLVLGVLAIGIVWGKAL